MPSAHCTGRERSTRKTGRKRADRQGAKGPGEGSGIHGLRGRGPWLRQTGEPTAILCRRRKIPLKISWWAVGGLILYHKGTKTQSKLNWPGLTFGQCDIQGLYVHLCAFVP